MTWGIMGCIGTTVESQKWIGTRGQVPFVSQLLFCISSNLSSHAAEPQVHMKNMTKYARCQICSQAKAWRTLKEKLSLLAQFQIPRKDWHCPSSLKQKLGYRGHEQNKTVKESLLYNQVDKQRGQFTKGRKKKKKRKLGRQYTWHLLCYFSWKLKNKKITHIYGIKILNETICSCLMGKQKLSRFLYFITKLFLV